MTESGENESSETGSGPEIEIRSEAVLDPSRSMRRREPYEVEVRETRW